MKSFKKILTLMLAVMLIATSMAMPVMAEEKAVESQLLIDTNLSNADDVYSMSGWGQQSAASWVNSKLGLSTSQAVYYNDNNNNPGSYMIFDAGENKSFTSATFTISVEANTAAIVNDEVKRNALVTVSDTAEDGSWISGATSTIVSRSANITSADVTYTLPTPSRYVKLQLLDGVFSGWQVYVHGAKLYGYEQKVESELLIDTNLSNDDDVYSMSGWGQQSAASWVNSKLGLSTSQAVYYNDNNNNPGSYMIFDAGENKSFTSATFTISVEANTAAIVNGEVNRNALVTVSDTAEDGSWISGATSTIVSRSAQITSADVTYTLPTPSRYVKLQLLGGVSGGWQVYVHGAKLYGYGAPVYVPERTLKEVIKSDLTTVDEISEVSGFSYVSWAAGRCGYDYNRNILNGSTKGAYVVFDAASKDSVFASGTFKVTMVPNNKGHVTQEYARNALVCVSDDGLEYTTIAPTSYELLSEDYDDANHLHSTFELKYDFDNVRFVKYQIPDDCWGGSHFIHGAELYGYTNLDYDGTPAITKTSTDWTVSGNLYNFTETAKTNATVFLAVYDGDKLVSAGLSEIGNVVSGSNEFTVSANVTGKIIASPKAKLFVWDATNYTPYLSVVEY